MLSRFRTIPACHGQTDRRTDGRTDRNAISISRVSLLTSDKNGLNQLTYACDLFLLPVKNAVDHLLIPAFLILVLHDVTDRSLRPVRRNFFTELESEFIHEPQGLRAALIPFLYSLIQIPAYTMRDHGYGASVSCVCLTSVVP